MKFALLFVAACSGSPAHAPRDAGPSHVVGSCSSLAPASTWEDVTPPEVRAQLPGPSDCVYGVSAYVVDPSNPATIYLGTCEMGVWKTTDCGGTWTRINSGQNGAALDHGRQWTFVVDPTDPQTLYTNSGYNAFIQNATWDGNGVSGIFKSTNGGVDWAMVWPQSMDSGVEYSFAGQLQIDPLDHAHLLLSFHAKCTAPHTEACLGESHDGGATWKLLDLDPSWTGGESQMAWFLDGGKRWLWGSASNGLYRTDDGGGSWQLIDKNAQGHVAGQLVRAKDGTFYLAANQLWRSPDGKSWSAVDNGPAGPIAGLVTDGTTLYAANGFPWGPGHATYEPFWSSPDGLGWAQLGSPMLTNGGELAWDADHRLLYSSNEEAGFYRVVLP